MADLGDSRPEDRPATGKCAATATPRIFRGKISSAEAVTSDVLKQWVRRQRPRLIETRHMSHVTRHWLFLTLLLAPLIARGDFREFRAIPVDPALTAALTRTADATLKDYPKLTADNF